MAIDAETRARIEARHHEVLGAPPRLPPVARESVAAQVQADTAHLSAGATGNTATIPLDRIPEIMFTMCRYPDLWRRYMDLSIQIQGAAAVLPVRARKLAILRTGWLCQAPYEFGEHVNQSLRAGLTTEEIERIVTGSSAPEWNANDRAVLRATEELHANAMVSDEVWDQLSAFLDEAQRVELLILIGQFVATAYFQNSLRLRLETNNKGLMAAG